MTNPIQLSIPVDRVERVQYMRRMFPQAKGRNLLEEWQGGRQQAMQLINAIDAEAYGRNRNFINGSVSKLSPYIRHGCVTISEVAEHVLKRFGQQAEKFISELAYKDFFRQNWYRHGKAIFSEMEPPKVELGYKDVPLFVQQGFTGLPCMDEVVRDLTNTGYVHNHARMWFAAYIVHWLKIDWRKAADWFESMLIDGDKASNHLSWQWVASSFSNKPYYFNHESLARFTGEKYCANCHVTCPFDNSYEGIYQQLFSDKTPTEAKVFPIEIVAKEAPSDQTKMFVLVHDEMLSPENSLLKLAMPKIFVFDTDAYANWPIKRLQFVADCLAELPEVQVWVGDLKQVLQQADVGQIISQNTPNLQFKAKLSAFKPIWQEEVKFTQAELSLQRLERFTRYWDKVGPEVMANANADSPQPEKITP